MTDSIDPSRFRVPQPGEHVEAIARLLRQAHPHCGHRLTQTGDPRRFALTQRYAVQYVEQVRAARDDGGVW